MNNPLEDNSHQDIHSQLDALMESLGIDPHLTDSQPQHLDSIWQDASQLHPPTHDSFNSGWDVAHSGQDSGVSDPSIQDLNHSGWSDLSHPNNFEYPSQLEPPSTELSTRYADLSPNVSPDLASYDEKQLDTHQTLRHEDSSTSSYSRPDTNELHHPGHASVFNYAESSLSETVHIYPDGDVYWDSGGKAGYIKGNEFYNSGGYKIAYLGADWNIYDANDKRIGYIDSSGNAHNLAGTVIANGGTARWAAAQLVYNFCSRG
jgi:hypothetical protein